jgi:hypothetical protein
MSGTTIIGKNASVFSLIGATTYNLLGKWKDVEFTLKYNYTNNTTPADATEPVRLEMTYEWTAKLSGLIQSDTDSAMFTSAMSSPNVQVVFTNSITGSTINVTGGIEEATMKMQQEGFEDTLTVQSLGTVNGAPSISWTP